ncbi:uncharacterized protein KIAA1522 homolog isoform X2 [Kryptolebias marmoratus]|uniref:NHS like 3 n=1 Tax=Kryptolebias marmoratus TaxID=37003 RepID=A0A3Q3BRM1_KRYMA|nr:uncharacterized protein KIAA1522 homolog isoform X2 [Kryptolebias marmoratus]
MGNSVHKKKRTVQTEQNASCPPFLTPSPKRGKLTSSWLLGRPDKLKTAGPKAGEDQKRLAVHYTASQHYQENVFIEGSRPQYLEDLHTEAQEGLKILQQEEHKNGVNFDDDESIASTDTLRPEQDIRSKDRVGSPESTTGNTDIPVTSAASTRPVLTHQGSTFKPLNPVKKADRSRKRNRRTTIMGIPNQVQKELALNRSSTFQPLVSTKLPDHDEHDADSQPGVVVIPTVDGGTPAAKKEGARVHLSELEVFRDEALQAVYQNEQSHLCPTSGLRPKSLAVPGMTTSFSLSPSTFNFLQEPQGPVMSISPQATYLSTIIPNAVLPASVEVIEIDRSISRTRGGSVNHGSSIRTVSKSSLTSGDSAVSPLLSRRTDGDGSHSNSSNYDMPKSASGSNWSESQSSKMIISDSLHTFSNKVERDVQESPTEPSKDQDVAHLSHSASVISSPSSKNENTTEVRPESGTAESVTAGEQAKNKHNFSHSLSVTKTRQPPAPPQRTNSLHGNRMRSHSKMVVDIKGLSSSASEDGTNISTKPTPVSSSTGSSPPYSGPLSSSQASSNPNEAATTPPLESSASPLQKNPPEGEKFERTMSPSSGYSSQSGTPTLSPKGLSPTSPDKQRKNPVKPERSASRASSSAASPSSSLASLSLGTSEYAGADVSACGATLSPRGSSPTAATEGPPPNSHSSGFQAEVRGLLNIPPPPRVKAPCPPPPETWAHNRRTVELLCGKVVQKPAQLQVSTEKQTEAQTRETQVIGETKPILEGSDTEHVQEKENVDVQIRDGSSVSAVRTQETTPKKDPPPVMKKPTKALFSADAERPPEAKSETGSAATDVRLSADRHPTRSQNVVDSGQAERGENPPMQTLSVEVPKISKMSPPPTPPPAYQPTPPLTRRIPSPSISVPLNEEEARVEDSCWPPPPPPLEGDAAFDGSEEADFPLPPPPSVAGSTTDVPDPTPAVGVSKADIVDDTSRQTVQTISRSADGVSPPPAETAPASPVPLSDAAGVPPGGSLNQNSLKTEDPSPPAPQLSAPATEPAAPPPPPPTENVPLGLNFRRQSSGSYRDTRSKELLSRHKSSPIPKEDANIPLVTPSLLQMVRLRSVSMTEDQVKATLEDNSGNEGAPVQDNYPVSAQGSQNIPQKPIRKSLSMKSSPQAVKTPTVTISSPSMRLQEAIRMKTAAMSSKDGLPSRLGVKFPSYSCVSQPGAPPPKSPEGRDTYKSSVSTASFIFSRSAKKVVVESVAASSSSSSSSETQASLKQSLAAELRQVSEQSKAGAFSNGRVRCDKVPPPVAKKPAPGSLSPSPDPHKPERGAKGNGALGVQQGAPPETTTRVTADTIETLF